MIRLIISNATGYILQRTAGAVQTRGDICRSGSAAWNRCTLVETDVVVPAQATHWIDNAPVSGVSAPPVDSLNAGHAAKVVDAYADSLVLQILPPWRREALNDERLRLIEKRLDGTPLTQQETTRHQQIRTIIARLRDIADVSDAITAQVALLDSEQLAHFNVTEHPDWP